MNWLWVLIVIVAVLYILSRAFRGSVKHSAVQNAFLAKYTYDQMPIEQKSQVQDQALQITRRGGLLDEDISLMSEMLKFSFYALAMAELGIPPALPKEEWHYTKNPYLALHGSEHQVRVVKHHLENTHNVKIDLTWSDHLRTPKSVSTEQETDPTVQQRFATSFVYAKEKLLLSKEEAENFARTEMLRDRFFREAFRLPHNVSLKLLYLIPTLVLLFLAIIGIMLNTNWRFYAPALAVLALWTNSRKWSSFWVPMLYWFKPFVKEIKIAENDLNPSDWKSYFFLPSPHGRANIKMMIKACHDEVCHFGPRLLIRSLLGTHGLFLGVFAVLAYLSWR